MPTDLPEGERDVLWNDGEFILARVRNQFDRSPTLLVRPSLAHLTAASYARLNHAYALRDELEVSWAAQPTELTDRSGELSLLMRDPGGHLLATLIGRPWDVGPFLRVGIGIARALSGLHRRGLVHNNLKPSNIFVDVTEGKAWLAGFAFTTRLERERHASSQPQLTAGALAYVAPEQTGRMNRTVDTRSDLYSLGVILYEMLKGTLPFQASEPIEWIHCHIARPPAPLGERVHEIPPVISAIVLKLLAKNPEDRYQTARGVETDVWRCLSEWESAGSIEQFPLAAHDVPDRLLIPERLYGRQHEIALLSDAFERVARDGKQTLVLVSGYSGVGKSSAVNELRQAVVQRRGLFLRGKFEPHERDTPFAPIVRAFRDLVRWILVLSDADVNRWREDICRALGANAQLVIDFLPEVGLIIGPQEPVADIAPQQAKTRFYRVLQRFVGVFARSEHPLVLFVDDLQWLDRASLDLLQNLATHGERMHLLLVGAYRRNEVGPTHPLTATLSAIRSVTDVQEIDMASLHREDVHALISDALHQSRDHIGPLAEVVYEKTAGSPFFVKQFLHELANEGCLTFDTSAGAWTWDLAQIQAKKYTENVFDLLAAKLDRLSATTQRALRHLACLSGGRTDALSISLECSVGELHATLSEATEAGLVWRGEEGYAFSHDRIREAAYALIPERERAVVHLKIGRSLLAKLPALDTSEKVFEVADQLNRGAALFTSPEERLRIAELNLTAGRSARATTAYESSLVYLSAGESLLSEEHWERHYALRFSLALHRAECEFLTGELAAADERLSRLRERAISSTDLAAVASLRITVNITMNRTDGAIKVGLEQLRAFGIEWSDHPNEDEVQAEYELLRRHLGEHPIETLAELVSTRDPDVLAVMQILREMLPAAIFIDKNLHHLAVLRMSNLSLDYGHCDSSPLAFAELSMVIGPRFGHRHDGFRFGNLGMALAERGDLARFRGKVYVVVGYHVLPWTGPVRAALAVMRRALALTQEAGDMQFATFSAVHVSALRLAAGDPLEDVQAEAERHLAFCRYAGFQMVVYCFLGQLQLMRSLRGQPDLQKNDPAGSEEATVEQVFAQDPSFSISACWYWVRKLQARFHAGDYAVALEMAARAERLLWTSPTFFGELTEYHFYSALAQAKAWDSAPKAEAPGHHQALAGHHALLANWAASCPGTFGSRAALAAAELARIEDRVLDAERFYEEAICSASAAGFANIEALASEMAGQFHRNRGFERLARTYFVNASSCYRRWGATEVARRLDAYSGFAAPSVAFRPTDTTTASVEELDLATVIKASQTISGEILIDKLVETLMVTAVEHAGAEKGRLIIRRGEELRIAAEATTQLDAITVRLLRTAAERSDLPHTVLNYVLRTQEAIILDDAAVANQFSADSYLAEHRVRSLLCVPLVKQMTLVGVLFLENSVASHVFTPSRTALLKLLASQAAISLENARLFEDLQESQQYLAEAQRLSQTGSWAWNPATGEIRYWSEECYRILGFDPSQPPPRYETFFQRIHPDDRAASRQRFEKAIHEKADFEFGYRIVHPDKGLRDIHVVGHAVLDRFGGLGEFVGTVIDITEGKRAEQELQQLVDFVPQHIVVLDADGKLIHTNRAVREYTGLRHEEFRNVPDVIGGVVHPDDVERMRAARERGLAGTEPFELDARLLGKDGIYRWFLARYNPLVEEGRVRRWYMSATEIESRKQEEERVRKENVRLEERTRIAQELHDTLLQTFQSASLHLSAALYGVAQESPVKPLLDQILQIMRQGIEEGRNAIQGLRSPGSQTSDLALALSRIQGELKVQPDIDFRVMVTGREKQLPSQIRDEIYRIGREALVNAFRHSGAKRVELELEYSDKDWRMRIRDDGRGIDPQVLEKGRDGHWGLAGMRERATRIGGLLKILSSPTSGTEVQLSIPSGIA